MNLKILYIIFLSKPVSYGGLIIWRHVVYANTGLESWNIFHKTAICHLYVEETWKRSQKATTSPHKSDQNCAGKLWKVAIFMESKNLMLALCCMLI